MQVFVTGGSGFLGRNLIERLIREGHKVSALSRSAQSGEFLKKLGAQPISGSLDNISHWENHLSGNDSVVHCAAPVEFWGPWDKFYKEITIASQELLLASNRQAVKQFIFISSESVLQQTASLIDIDETYPTADEPNSYYGKAKKMAEETLLNSDGKTNVIIIRPPYIWGNDDNGTFQILEKVKKGQFMWVNQGDILIETAHVNNVVEAIIRSLSSKKSKSIYFVTDDEPVKVRDFFESLFKSYNIRIPRKNVPNFVAKASAMAIENIWKLLRIKQNPPLSVFDWAFVGMPRKYNISKIKTELGYKPITSRKEGFNEITKLRSAL